MYLERFDPLRGERLEILDADGRVEESLRPPVTDDRVRRLYGRLHAIRAADRMALKLQREGRMGTYAPMEGQEACQLAADALGASDWLVPSYRETGAMWLRGVPLATLYRYWIGDERGSVWPEELRVLPVSIPVGSQALHAVGLGWAMKLRGEASAVLVYFGDGATSEGEVLEAMNFAGVFGTPTVFFCQNNQYAISVPRKRQTAARTIAQKAVAFGFPGIQVYGNDLLAVLGAVGEALDRARSGQGPALVEALTYRLGPHTTADDPTRYRDDTEVARMRAFDPLLRVRRYLEGRGLWSEEDEVALEASVREEVDRAVAEAYSLPEPDPAGIFDYTYAELPPDLRRQKEAFLQFLGEEASGG
ncbi:MAG: pyruvate dehydrogenase (acetyl-transferring) E1 component subunit alpha [Deferrisomatales bacterium]|nr:pyruvate dehydrogenase (acetyl-transferring) E1 component subunit alpha [Deferrisomatales bacterium]